MPAVCHTGHSSRCSPLQQPPLPAVPYIPSRSCCSWFVAWLCTT
jgi:hypothetical protein